MTTKRRTGRPEREEAESTGPETGALDPEEAEETEEAARPAEKEEVASTTIMEVTRTVTVVTRLPRIDDYVEDLIDPEFGLASAHETTRAAGKKLLDGFNGTLREMAAAIPPKRRRDP